ncbi:hypothetical protein [Salinithrix halophila]|uniref:Uncharacterized protein n=1 Tax=Salinithrix halophila TaxID=1485204 RepID=A0ABV8JIJ4_9BACL
MAIPSYERVHDERLRVDRPVLYVEYESLSEGEQQEFELLCQEICAQIPPRIKAFEEIYMDRFEALHQAENDEAFYHLLEEMNDISSRIADLNVLFLHIEGNFIAASIHS